MKTIIGTFIMALFILCLALPNDDDKGASLTWIATDAERRDDVGVPSDLSKVVRCESFPLSSFEFPEIKFAGGELQVLAR
jgi:hypothetical protein